jgi:hypothetical protein
MFAQVDLSVSLQDLVLQAELNQDDPAELAAWNQPQMQGAPFYIYSYMYIYSHGPHIS